MQECDLIMQGGTASGVVYPYAVTEIAKDYRLRNIGGTSAGAIAAVLAAAAEYRRQAGGGTDWAGFAAIERIAIDMGSTLESLFQPSPDVAPLFTLLRATISDTARRKGKPWALLLAGMRIFRWPLVIAMIAMAAFLVAAFLQGDVWLGAFGVALAVMAFVTWAAAALTRWLFKGLPRHNFGLCTGHRQDNAAAPALTDWLTDQIDLIAGNMDNGALGAPLTVGQLEGHQIGVAAMTTDLSTQRPYQLPLQTRIHFFSEAEFLRLFPERVVSYLKGENQPIEHGQDGVPKDLYPLPDGPAFPVVLVARLSLSFPGLIEAVPLWRHDYELPKAPDDRYPLRRCLFSDGGISSNFPIHFFDALLPTRPTFGISLSNWEEVRHGQDRLFFPTTGRTSTNLPVQEIDGIGGFLFAILNTAKDWQDTMQSMLPGYAERIATVRLDKGSEGGMNLTMSPETIAQLTRYGRHAGVELRKRFSYVDPETLAPRRISGFDQHRYNRAISLLPELEEALSRFAAALKAQPQGAPSDAYTGRKVLTDFKSDHFGNTISWRKGPFVGLADAVGKIGQDATEAFEDPTRKSVREGRDLPSIDTAIRLAALVDRIPRTRRS